MNRSIEEKCEELLKEVEILRDQVVYLKTLQEDYNRVMLVAQAQDRVIKELVSLYSLEDLLYEEEKTNVLKKK